MMWNRKHQSFMLSLIDRCRLCKNREKERFSYSYLFSACFFKGKHSIQVYKFIFSGEREERKGENSLLLKIQLLYILYTHTHTHTLYCILFLKITQHIEHLAWL